MAILDVTYHSTQGSDFPTYRKGAFEPISVLPPQVGNSEQLDFTGGPVGGAASQTALIAAFVADEDCRVAIGEGIAATVQNSRKIVAGVPDFAYIPLGARISVMAA